MSEPDNKVDFLPELNSYIFNCPHCGGIVQVAINEVNCQIFRHAIFKHNGQQVPPHASEKMCIQLQEQNKIFGCCKPFRLEAGSSGKIEKVIICDYI